MIKFRGLSLTPDELSAQEGSLAFCGGLENHNGAMRPAVLQGESVIGLVIVQSDGTRIVPTLLYVHVTTQYRHYICCYSTERGERQLVWFQEGQNGGRLADPVSFGGLFPEDVFFSGEWRIDAIGNTLIAINDTGVHYFLFQTEEGNYTYLGQQPPMLSLEFSTGQNRKGDYDRSSVDHDVKSEEYYSAWEGLSCGANEAAKILDAVKGTISIKPEFQAAVTEGVWACVNKANEVVAKDGGFYASFFVRYCYRLYDGTQFYHSAPIYIPVSEPHPEQPTLANAFYSRKSSIDGTCWLHDSFNVKEAVDGDEFRVNSLTLRYSPRNVQLTYRIRSQEETDALKKWQDVIKSVDVFVSAPVTRADRSQLIKKAAPVDMQYQLEDNALTEWDGHREYVTDYPDALMCVGFDLNWLSDEAFEDKKRNTAEFFRVCSLKVEDLQAPVDWDVLPYDKAALRNISVQEQMTDDYKSHNLLLPTGMYFYNRMLHLYGISEKLYAGSGAGQLLPQTDINVGDATLMLESEKDRTCSATEVWVRLRTAEGPRYVKHSVENGKTVYVSQRMLDYCPVFYPDSRAVEMYIKVYSPLTSVDYTGAWWFTVPLDAHNSLNSAVSRPGRYSLTYATTATYDATKFEVRDICSLKGKLYQSEIDNPYFFPLEGITTVGMGDIMGVVSVTRALSSGTAFGTFPLLAFCTDGIWALEVADNGRYGQIRPLSREVCSNSASITPLDQSACFVSKRGISVVNESEVTEFSQVLSGPWFNVKENMPQLVEFLEDTETGDYDTAALKDRCLAMIGKWSWPIYNMQQCRVLFDYAGKRILLFPPGDSCALVYMPANDTWSMLRSYSVPESIVRGYPYPVIQFGEELMTLDRPYDYTDTDQTISEGGLLITRPMSMGEGMQALAGFTQHHTAHLPQIVFFYGSDDCRTWHYIGRSDRDHADYLPAHSFRYLRLAVFSRLSMTEEYSGIDLNVVPKYSL